MDQWEGEAAAIYAPYLKGRFSLGDLLAGHNDHHILPTRLLSLIHLELAGEWNTRLEMTLGALVHCALIIWLSVLLISLVSKRHRLILSCFIALLFAIPIGYENLLWGFQSQVYFVSLFGLGALVGLSAARPFSWRWAGGICSAILSFLSFGTGVAAILAAASLVSTQLVVGIRSRCRREVAGVALIWLIAVILIIFQVLSSTTHSNLLIFVKGCVSMATPAGLAMIPAIWLCRRTLAMRPPVTDQAWVIVGMAWFVVMQLLLIAYGRGAAFAIRYLDILILLYPIAIAALLLRAETRVGVWSGRRRVWSAPAWLFVVVSTLVIFGYYISTVGAVEWSRSVEQQAVNARAYFSTGNADHLRDRGGSLFDLSFPSSQRLAAILQDPDVRATLPGDIRPAGADIAEARRHLWLRGSVSGETASVVETALLISPAVVAIGLGSFFALGLGGNHIRPKDHD
ncbi:MAG: hypothetical protein CK429_01425 [Mycobacterium sp.]|nr:MAG: hypothetical protein CK429_01425 [Mycobacterium sp.]